MNKNSVEGKPCINRESKSLEPTIELYSFCDEHEAPRSFNTTVNLLCLLYPKDVKLPY